MKIFLAQLKFDGERQVVRNFSYIFFTLLMPALFYLLFTKVMAGGTNSQMVQFSRAYMSSMIVYSGALNALFGLSATLLRDRQRGLLTWLRLTPGGTWPYYLSIGCWNMVINALAVGLMSSLAVFINHVSLSALQWLEIVTVLLISMLPMGLLGILLSFIPRVETLSMVSNLVTFPMAIMSGLWWPISELPSWLQVIGRLMPTFFANDLLGELLAGGTLKAINLIGLASWMVILGVAVVAGNRFVSKRGGGFVTA